nr:mucin-16-like [Loxodonta africana]
MTSSVTETNTVFSYVSTDAATTEVSWTEFTFSRASITDPIQLKSSPNTSIQSGTSLSDSARMPFTTQTDISSAKSQGALNLDTSTMASWSGMPLVVTQGFLHSEMTTRMSKGSEDVSMSRPPPVGRKQVSSFSLSAFPATTSPSPVLSTLQGYSPSSLLPVTPVFTSDLVKTADMLGTSLEPGTSSPPNLSSTSGDTLTTFEATKDMEAIHTSTNTVVATVGATSSGHKGHSSVLAPSEPTRVTSSVGTTFIMGETSVSRSLPEYSETTGIEAESTSSLTHGLRETRTSLDSSLDQWTPVYVSTGAATEVPRTEAISFSRTFVPGSTHFKMSPNTPTERNTNPFISRLRSVSSGITFATTTGPPRATSQGVFTLDTSATNSWAGISSVLTKGFPHSEMTTLRDDHSQTTLRDDRQDVLSPLSVEEASSLSSMAPTPATTSPSSVSSMLQEDSPSFPHPGTSVLTSGPVKTTTNLGTSLEPDHSSLPNVSSTTGKILSTSEDTTDTEAIHPSTDTTGATAGTTSSEHVSLSLVPAHSEPFMVTSPVVITSSMVDFTLSTSQLASPENTRIETKPSSSFSNGVSETNTYQGTNSPTETYNVLSHVSTGVATTELSKTEIPSSDRALIPASTQSTWPPEIFSGTSSRPSISPVMTGSVHKTLTTQTVSLEPATSLDALTLDTLSTASSKGIHFVSSRPSGATSSLVTSTTSTLIPVFYETTRTESGSTSSLTPGLTEYSTSQMTVSATDISPLPAQVSIGAATNEVSRMELTSSERLFNPGPEQSKSSTDISTKDSLKPSTSPLMKDSAGMTLTTHTGTLTLDTLITTSWAGTPSVLTQDFPHSEMTTLMSRSPKDVSSPPSVEETSFFYSLVHIPATTSSSSVSSTLPEPSPSSPLPVTSTLTSDPVTISTILSTNLKPGTSSPSSLSNASVEIKSTSETTTNTEAIHLSTNTTTTVMTASSRHELVSSVPIHSELSRTTYAKVTAFSMEDTTIPMSMPASLETTSFETTPLSHLTPGLRDTSRSLDSGSAVPTYTPASPVSTRLLKNPKTDTTSSVTIPIPDQSPSSQSSETPVEAITHLYASPSVTGSPGETSLLESNLTAPVSGSTHHLSTDMPPSAETTPADILSPSLPEAMASFGTTGVLGTSSAALSANPFPMTESSPGVDTISTIAENLPSLASTPFPSSTFTTTDSSTSPTVHGMTSSSAAPHAMDTSLGAESSTAKGLLMMASTLEMWTQPIRTSLSPIEDTRITESVDLGTLTSGSQIPSRSTPLTRTDGIVEPITKIPNEAAHVGSTRPTSFSQAPTSPANPRGMYNFAYFQVVQFEALYPVPER